MRRLKNSPAVSAVLAVFFVCGCNFLETSLFGGVWNIAQGTAFFFTSACFYLVNEPRGGSRLAMVVGPLMIAFAVGCRPFQAIYVPWVLYRLYRWCEREDRGVLRTLAAMIPYVILPGMVAVTYGAYNYVRFGNIFEFGHNYLPEFSTQGGIQFSLSHWPNNLRNIFRLPYFEDGMLVFPRFNGFAFYLCNPLFVMAAVETLRRLRRGEMDAEDWMLVALAFVHFNLLMLHRTFGGWQFGTRYLIDLLPAVFFFTVRKKRALSMADVLLMIWGVVFNIYGGVVFHFL